VLTFVAILKPLLFYNTLSFLVLILIPSVVFGMNIRYIVPSFIYFFLLARMIIFFPLTTAFYVFYAAYTVVVLWLKNLKHRFVLSKRLLASVMFLIAIGFYDVLLLFLEVTGGEFVYEAVRASAYSVLFTFVGYLYYKISRVHTKSSLFLNLFVLLAVTIFYLFVFQRALTVYGRIKRDFWLGEIFGIETSRYTRVDPNFFSVYFGILAALFLSKETKYFLIATLLLILLNLSFLYSVTGIFIIIVMLFYIMRDKSFLQKVLFIVAIASFLVGIIVKYIDVKYKSMLANVMNPNLLELTDIILTGRLSVWLAYIRLIVDNPFGVSSPLGWLKVSQYLGFPFMAHNFWLEVMAYWGLLMGIVIFGIIFLIYFRLHHEKRRNDILLASVIWFLASLVLSMAQVDITYFLFGSIICWFDMRRKELNKHVLPHVLRT